MDMIEPGMRFESAAEVGPDNTASVMGSGDMEVLATPSMVALMENAAMRAVERALPEGSTTVGTRIDVSHVRASAPGEPITATAEVTESDGRRIVFCVRASDSQGLIGEGTHERFVVDRKKFMARLKK